MALRTVGVRLAAEVTGYVNSLRAAAGATKDFTGQLDGAAKAGKLDAVAHSAGAMGLSLAGGFAAAVGAAAKFDQQMSKVGAVAGASAGEMSQLRQAALDAGKATSFSASEAAMAEEELAKAGLKTSQILGGALNGALSLAAAGSLGLAEAADIAAKTMNIFGLQGKDVSHIADVLSAAANKSATDVHEMGAALQMGGLAAHAAGMGLEETSGTLAAFADNALAGSDAGTSLKTMLMMLQAPTPAASKLMKELGLHVYDAGGNFIGTAKLAGELQKALGGMTQEQRNAALAQIFGADAMRAANVLYTVGEKGVRDYVTAVNDQGAAARAAADKTNNLMGDVERLKGSLETLAIQAGSGANTGLRSLVKAADALVGAFASLPGPVQSTITVLAGVSGAGLLAVAGLIKLRGTVGDAMQALRDIGPAGEKAAAGIGKLGKAAAGFSLISIGILAVFEGMQAFGNWVEKKNAPVKADIDSLTSSIKEFANTGKAVGELADKYGSNLQRIGQDVAGITKGMADLAQTQADVAAGLSDPSVMDGWNPVDPQAQQRVKDLDQALSQLVSSGGASTAKIFLDQLRSSGSLTGEQFAQLMKMLPGYNQAASGAAQANTGLAKGFGTTAANAATMNNTLADAIDKGQKLTDVWNQLHGAVLSSDEAMLKAQKAVDNVATSFKNNGKAIEGNSQKALENRIAVGQAAQAAADAAQKKYEETNSLQLASQTYDTYIGALRRTLTQAGLTKGEIESLIARYTTMPPPRPLVITADTSPALASAYAMQQRINSMTARINVQAAASTSYGGSYHTGLGYSPGMRWGGITEHAQTGLLREAGVYSPKGPARYAFAEPATGGEAFVPKYGDRKRSLGILDRAAGWYGATVQPQRPMYAVGGGGGGAQVVEHRHVIVIEGTGVLQGLRKEVRIQGGIVQNVLGV